MGDEEGEVGVVSGRVQRVVPKAPGGHPIEGHARGAGGVL
jgi:hypothetical protein